MRAVEFILGIFCVILIGYFIFNVVAKDLKKEKKVSSSFESLNDLKDEAENISVRKKDVLSETEKATETISEIKNKLNN